MHTLTIYTETATFTVTYTINVYPVFDNVQKVLTIFDATTHINAIAAFTGVIRYATDAFTIAVS